MVAGIIFLAIAAVAMVFALLQFAGRGVFFRNEHVMNLREKKKRGLTTKSYIYIYIYKQSGVLLSLVSVIALMAASVAMPERGWIICIAMAVAALTAIYSGIITLKIQFRTGHSHKRLAMAFHFIRNRVGVYRISRNGLIRKIVKVLIILPAVVIRNIGTLWRIATGKLGYVQEQVEISITPRCTLRCRDCANLMQYYDHPKDRPLDSLLKSIDGYMRGVDMVFTFAVLGGEPLLYKDLDKIIDHLGKYKKDGRIGIIRVVTNGTLTASDNVLRSFKRNGVLVSVSRYPGMDEKVDKVLKQLDKARVRSFCLKEPMTWTYYGDLTPRGRDEEALQRQYTDCGAPCKQIANGKLYVCPRAAGCEELGYAAANPGDSVDLLDDSKSTDELRREVAALYSKVTPVAACDFCNLGTDACVEIPSAIQMERKATAQ